MLQSMSRPVPPVLLTPTTAYAPGGTAPLCRMHVETGRLSFPRRGLNNWSVGAVVVRILLNPDGTVTDRTVAAALPSQQGFAEAIERVAPNWGIERAPDSPPGCRAQPVLYFTVQFWIE